VSVAIRLRKCAADLRRLFTEEGSTLKKALVVLVAVLAVIVLAPVLMASLVVFAAGDWRPVGQTEAGDKVSISSVRVLRNNQRLALVRIEYKEPAELPQGGPFVEMRARVRFNCASGVAAPTTEWFYSRDRGGRFVVSKKATHDEEFGKNPEGGFVGLVSQNVCSQSK
jgi:surface-adhesin protein E